MHIFLFNTNPAYLLSCGHPIAIIVTVIDDDDVAHTIYKDNNFGPAKIADEKSLLVWAGPSIVVAVVVNAIIAAVKPISCALI